jgi:NAD(P)-dependent dehydrogenase (short-subunit alcohol dehydrogenase family)
MGALDGKVAVITGSTSGIGARSAELFVAQGARVVLAGRREDRGRRLALSLGEAASFIRTDVTVEGDVKAMIEHAVSRFGRLDCLMNNAGSGSARAPIAEVDFARFDTEIGVHLRGALAGMTYAVPVMAAQKSGSIINVASINGTRAGLGGHHYSAAKAAVIHLSRCAAVELGERASASTACRRVPSLPASSARAPASTMTRLTSTPTTPRRRSRRCCRDGSRCPLSARPTTLRRPHCSSPATPRA